MIDSELHRLGDLFLRSLVKALNMKEKHAAVNKKFDAMFSDEHRGEWLRMIRDWEKDRSKPNPFTYTEKGGHSCVIRQPSHGTHIRLASNLAEVRRKLAEADEEDARRGVAPHEVPGSVFIRMALELEEQAYVLPPTFFLVYSSPVL